MVGDPIHVRTIAVEVAAAEGGRRAARGHIRDQRHQGWTYTGPLTIGPGLVHDMAADLVLDVTRGTIAAAEGRMDKAAFDPTPATAFEACRDVLPNVADLVGLSLDGDLAGAIRRAIGRERGCYHLTNLCLAMAPVVARATREPAPLRHTIEVTAHEADSPRVRFTGTLADDPQSRARLTFTVDPRDFLIADVDAADAPDCRPASAIAAALTGAALVGGFARVVVERLDGALRDLALAINAVYTQGMVIAGVDDEASDSPKANRAIGTCWMWRPGGPAERLPTGRARRKPT